MPIVTSVEREGTLLQCAATTTEFVIRIIDLCTFISSEEERGILIHSNVEKQLKGKK